jgi:hypothetical protein
MKTEARSRRPNALRGFLKIIWMLLALLFLLPVWFVRGIAARARFRAELRAAGVPQKAAKSLSDKYKIRLRDFGRFVSAENS